MSGGKEALLRPYMETITQLQERVAELEAALLEVRSRSFQYLPCWCVRKPEEAHSRRCIQARKAMESRKQ